MNINNVQEEIETRIAQWEARYERRTTHALENAREFFTPWKIDDEQNEYCFELHRQHERKDGVTLVYRLEAISRIIMYEGEPATETRFCMAQFEEDDPHIVKAMARCASLNEWIWFLN